MIDLPLNPYCCLKKSSTSGEINARFSMSTGAGISFINTVDGRNPVDMVTLSHDVQGFSIKSSNHAVYSWSSDFCCSLTGTFPSRNTPQSLAALPRLQGCGVLTLACRENLIIQDLALLTFSPLNMDGWKTFSFPFGFRPIFRGRAKLPGGTHF